jgi:hypothetical protein
VSTHLGSTPCIGVGRTTKLRRRFPEGVGVADNPQQTIRELRELIVAYVKQETIDPLKGMARYIAFGVAGAVLLGLGVMFIEIGALRLLQGWGPNGRGHRFNGNMSWAPYAIVLVGSVIVAVLFWVSKGKRASKTRAGRTP